MNPIYQQALNGTLQTRLGTELVNAGFVNRTELYLDLYWLGFDAQHWGLNPSTGRMAPGYPPIRLGPGQGHAFAYSATNSYFLFNQSFSGAFACVATQSVSNANVDITCDLLTEPNDIGTVPVPNQAVVIPPDSPRVLVGCGRTPAGYYLSREQYWHRLSESHTLAPGETLEVSYTVFTGMQRTTSEQKTVAGTVGVSASAGWGPISASVSASLSKSSTSFQQVTVTEERTMFISDTLENQTDKPRMLLHWQLTDVITAFDGNGNAASSIILRNNPTVIGGPYDPNALPPPPVAVELTAEMLASVPRVDSKPAATAKPKKKKKKRRGSKQR